MPTLAERLDGAIVEKRVTLQLMQDSAYGAGAAVRALRADVDLLTSLREERMRMIGELHKWQAIAVDLEPQYGRSLHPGGPHDPGMDAGG